VQPDINVQQQEQAQVVLPEQQPIDRQAAQDAPQDEQDEDDNVFESDPNEDSNDEDNMAEDRTLMPGTLVNGYDENFTAIGRTKHMMMQNLSVFLKPYLTEELGYGWSHYQTE